MKKILFIKNNTNSKISNNNFHVKIEYICSYSLINYSIIDLEQLIKNFDIIILGGGPQHLTSEFLNNHPEIPNQIKIIKIVQNMSKILIGICLGCQIIGLAYGMRIIHMPELCLGFSQLNTNLIDYEYINQTKNQYLTEMNFNIFEKSFSYHYDCIEWKSNTELIRIAESKNNIPYIIKHYKSNIFGFQFHPEISYECIQDILQTYSITFENLMKDFDSTISTHFLEIFINN